MTTAAGTEPWAALVGPEIEENLGLRYVSAALGRAGVATAIVPFNVPEDLAAVRARVLSAPSPPRLVALSLSFQWRARDFLGLAVALREAGYRGHITGGGHFGTFCRRELLRDFPELDSIVRFEAEETTAALALALARGEPLDGIAGLTLRDAEGRPTDTPPRGAPDLERLPWPDRRGAPASCLGHRIAPIVGSRGCYGSCAFCCIAAWHREGGGGRRFRVRPVDDVADELAWLWRELRAEIFIFHDDNFFLPRPADSLARIDALADALAARGVGRIATVVKARPNDLTREVLLALRERLGLSRVFLGVESDADRGLATLARRVTRAENRRAMDQLDELGIFPCFNLLVFDPDATPDDLEDNLAFLEAFAETPSNFGRVELYAGTPLLERMQAEGRCRGDYLGWDYRLRDERMQRVFSLAMGCFHPRNFAAGALANRLMGTRYDVEVARLFHPEVYRPNWLARARTLSERLACDTAAALREILAHVVERGPAAPAADLAAGLSHRMRAVERELKDEATALEEEIQRAVGARCVHARPVPNALEIGKCVHGSAAMSYAARNGGEE